MPTPKCDCAHCTPAARKTSMGLPDTLFDGYILVIKVHVALSGKQDFYQGKPENSSYPFKLTDPKTRRLLRKADLSRYLPRSSSRSRWKSGKLRGNRHQSVRKRHPRFRKPVRQNRKSRKIGSKPRKTGGVLLILHSATPSPCGNHPARSGKRGPEQSHRGCEEYSPSTDDGLSKTSTEYPLDVEIWKRILRSLKRLTGLFHGDSFAFQDEGREKWTAVNLFAHPLVQRPELYLVHGDLPRRKALPLSRCPVHCRTLKSTRLVFLKASCGELPLPPTRSKAHGRRTARASPSGTGLRTRPAR